MNFIKIVNQEEINILLDRIDWEDAFIRESYCQSPTYIKEHNLIAPDSLPSLILSIYFHDSEIKGIELRFDEVSEINTSFDIYYEPFVIIKNNEIFFSFDGNDNYGIRAKKLSYRINDEQGSYNLKYGKNNFFDEAGFHKNEY